MPSTLTYIKLVASLITGSTVLAQTPAAAGEVQPLLPTWKCTNSGGCVQQNTSVVLDFEYRNVHATEPADYAAMGVSTKGNAVTMYHYVKDASGKLFNATPRIYLLDGDGKYVMMKLLNQELTVDVDLSTLPCGENGAFYLSEMVADGSKNPGQFNIGGAGMGNGYCDAQCQGYCCGEMDIIEANSQANVFTGHPCKGNTCDKSGCGYNPFAAGQRNFYGPGKTVDTTKPFTVITQFQASGGRLTTMTRKYIQNGRTINSGTITNCGSEGSTGGLTGMGESLGRGMVLAMSIWNDAAQNMAWLDSGANGPCTTGQGSPSNIQSQHPDTHVVFSNIRWGDIGSTTKR
ncbi:glycoside hydrolase family 7 protein [Lasiosphaeria hispida]|uniref:cellulase n=1 Tax=Lasiosphaeria hispida TaxID=260671 RepID=A0AAJ0HFQ8_9PEZI|nr:glycoside hydrolase family 7 protein [Lasiosphaeria hispida]